MSADVLREAAASIRGCCDEGHPECLERDAFLLAVAAWLEATANSIEEAEQVSALYHMRDDSCDCASHREVRAAEHAARTYLGDPS